MRQASTTDKVESKLFWIVSVPNSAPRHEVLKAQIQPYATLVSKFNVPNLRVGTLDSLLALSEDLGKKDNFIEQVTTKIARQLHDLYIEPETGKMESHEKIMMVNGGKP